MRRGLAVVVVVSAIAGGCLLTTSLDGFTGGADVADAADAADAVATTDSSADSGGEPDAAFDARVAKLVLVRASNVTTIAGYDPLPEGATLKKSTLPAFTVVAVTSPTEVGSVVFGLDQDPTFQVENLLPYTLTGDNNNTATPWMPSAGVHTITAVPYAGGDGGGAPGAAFVLHVTVQP